MRQLLVAAAVGLVACDSPKTQPKVPLTQNPVSDSVRTAEPAQPLISPAARGALDSGNALFRRKAYAAALARYREASNLAPQHAAPFFGIYMVARAMNNPALADSALLAIKARNGSVPPSPPAFADTMLQRVHANVKKPVGG